MEGSGLDAGRAGHIMFPTKKASLPNGRSRRRPLKQLLPVHDGRFNVRVDVDDASGNGEPGLEKGDRGHVGPRQLVYKVIAIRIHVDAEAPLRLNSVMLVEGVVGNTRNETTLPDWTNSRITKPGGSSSPELLMLSGGKPMTCEVSQEPSRRRAITPNHTPSASSSCAPPVDVASRMHCNCAVIWRGAFR